MTIHGVMCDAISKKSSETASTDQVTFDMYWRSREKLYLISEVTLTHNPEYPTPAINITAPNPGIRFTVTDQDGNTLYTNVKPKEEK